MPKFIRINNELNIKCNKEIKEYLSPDYIYLPYQKGDSLNVKDKEVIYKNSIVLANKDNFIYSPISGTVIGICNNIVDGKQQKTIVIENNFEEKTRRNAIGKKDGALVNKAELIKKIKTLGAYKSLLKGNTMIINGIDNEPYEETFSYLIHEHTDEILETADKLISILGIHKCLFAIKNNDSTNVESLINHIGTYPNIELRLMPDIYPIGHPDVLINELVIESKIASGVICLTVEDIYNIYNVLKKNKPITEKLVTITGNLINKPKVVNVKIGTRIVDIIHDEFKILDENYHIVINGLLSGYEVSSLNTIITSNIKSIFIVKTDNSKPSKCINCGLCHINCPVKADPRSKLNMNKCIKCGLCNYICPSKIKIVGDKNE